MVPAQKKYLINLIYHYYYIILVLSSVVNILSARGAAIVQVQCPSHPVYSE